MTTYRTEQPDRADLDATQGPAVVMFGTNWCGFCLAADRYLAPALAEHPDLPVHAVEDGKGRPLGRSYRVKLWPTVIFLRDGREVDRLVRPTSRGEVDQALAGLLTTDVGSAQDSRRDGIPDEHDAQHEHEEHDA